MRSISFVFLFGVASSPAFADGCAFSAQRNFDVDAVGLATVSFALGSSDLKVEGVPGLAKVEVRGHACASSAALLDGLTVEHRRDGDRLLVTPRNERSGSGLFGSERASLDLRVRVPAAVGVIAEGTSADVEALGVAAVDFSSSSGDLVAERIAGAVTTKASSGDIRARDIGRFDSRGTGSGDISASKVRGDAKVANSGSGDLDLDDIDGSVVIGTVGSGDVQLRRVKRDAEVGTIGSGDIVANDIGGNLHVGSKGSGDIEHRGVRGTVSVPQRD